MGRTAGFCRYRHLFGEGPVVLRGAPPTTEKPFQWRNFESFFFRGYRPPGSFWSGRDGLDGGQRRKFGRKRSLGI